jgi:signal transduction histidine kinase
METKHLILIIDDSNVNLTLLCNILQQHNFCVELANNGEKGLALAKQTIPDIILLDVIMPGWDGYETCWRMKQEASLANIPILFLSALGNTKNKVRALQAGGVDYISKPFQKEELLARVQTHIELSHLRHNLEREVANQTEKVRLLIDALQLSYDRAQQASMLKTAFLRNISHEFRTPMNIVLGMTEMLIEETVLTEEQHEYAESVMKAGNQLMDILTNMLNFAQQFKGEIKQVLCEFYIHEVINDVLIDLSQHGHAKNLPITIEIAPKLHKPLRGNRDGIYKVLSKLVDNAIKFTEQGEILIRVQQLESYDKQQWVRFEISDTGIGIAPEKQTHLFEIFSQVDSSSTRVYEGMGMGLAIAKMFTENMDGQIGVDSVVGKGSTFWFKVPLVRIVNDEL